MVFSRGKLHIGNSIIAFPRRILLKKLYPLQAVNQEQGNTIRVVKIRMSRLNTPVISYRKVSYTLTLGKWAFIA